MCRQEIPRDFIEHPNLLQAPHNESVEGFDGGYQWFYEGRNGKQFLQCFVVPGTVIVGCTNTGLVIQQQPITVLRESL